MIRWTFAVAVVVSLVTTLGVAACGNSREEVTSPTLVTFLLSGVVHDTAFRPLAGVRVEVDHWPGHGAFGVTDADGRYEFLAIFSNSFVVRASKQGYVSKTNWYFHPTGRPPEEGGSLSFQLEPSDAEVDADITGNYTLTFTADDACSQLLPAPVRTRTYQAAITPWAGVYQVTLTGARFYEDRDSGGFVMRVVGSFAEIRLNPDIGDQFWPLMEQLAPSTYLRIWGTADLPMTGPTHSAPFAGSLTYCTDTDNPEFCKGLTCGSSNHRLTLTRR